MGTQNGVIYHFRYVGSLKVAVWRLALCHLTVSDQDWMEMKWSYSLRKSYNHLGCQKLTEIGMWIWTQEQCALLTVWAALHGTGMRQKYYWLCFCYFLPLLEGKKLQKNNIMLSTFLEIHLETSYGSFFFFFSPTVI